MRNYYMVRAKNSNKEAFDIFFNNNVVAVGWSRVDFSKELDSKKLRKKVLDEYYQKDQKQNLISKKLNEVERFKNIKKGDFIVVPYYSYIAIAEVEDEEIYFEKGTNPDIDLANQRAVTYRYKDDEPLIIPRNDLSEGLQRRLRVRGNTVSNLYEFKDEIEEIFNKPSYSYSKKIQEIEQIELEKLKRGLLENIQKGKSNLQTGGIGLENLVCEIMKCEGYESKILAKNKFQGKADADISAIKEDSFMSKKILVQVKHHDGESGSYGIQQVIDVLKQKEYEEYEGYFITSGFISDETRKIASENNIDVMDGEELVQLIIDNLDKLSKGTKRLLGICSIPTII